MFVKSDEEQKEESFKYTMLFLGVAVGAFFGIFLRVRQTYSVLHGMDQQ